MENAQTITENTDLVIWSAEIILKKKMKKKLQIEKSPECTAINICCNRERGQRQTDCYDVQKLLWTVITTVTPLKLAECHQLLSHMCIMGSPCPVTPLTSFYGCELSASFTIFCYFSAFSCCWILFLVHFMLSNDEEIKENVMFTSTEPEWQAGLLQKGCFTWFLFMFKFACSYGIP